MEIGIQHFEVLVSEDNDLSEIETANVSVVEETDRASNPWFGYIGLGIILVSMVVGLIGVVLAVFFFIRWTQ